MKQQKPIDSFGFLNAVKTIFWNASTGFRYLGFHTIPNLSLFILVPLRDKLFLRGSFLIRPKVEPLLYTELSYQLST